VRGPVPHRFPGRQHRGHARQGYRRLPVSRLRLLWGGQRGRVPGLARRNVAACGSKQPSVPPNLLQPTVFVPCLTLTLLPTSPLVPPRSK
jgi:hypothetical protein